LRHLIANGVLPVQICPFGPETFLFELDNLTRLLPVYSVAEDMAIVANESLSFGADVQFTATAGKLLATRLQTIGPELLLTAEAKPLSIVYETCRALGIRHFVVARKRITLEMKDVFSVKVRSVSTATDQQLHLDGRSADLIRGKRIAIVDDVFSTGATLNGLMTLANKAGAHLEACAAVWVEGPWTLIKHADRIRNDRFFCLGVLPVFAKAQLYDSLSEMAAQAIDAITCR